MRIRQGQFAYLPDLTDDELAKQISYAIGNGWGIGVEYTDDPHPRNMYWEMWGQPQFGVERPEQVLDMVRTCRQEHPQSYVAVTAFKSTRHRQGIMLHIVVQRPEHEPELRIQRQVLDRSRQGYTLTATR